MAERHHEVLEVFQSIIGTISALKSYSNLLDLLKSLKNSVFELINSEIFLSGNQASGNFILNLLNTYLNSLKSLVSNPRPTKSSIKAEIFLVAEKIRLIVLSLPNAFNLPLDDFEFLPEDHPRRQALDSVSSTFTEDPEKISKQVAKFIKQYKQIKATFFVACKYKPSKARDLLTSSLLIYYSLFPKKCEKAFNKSNTTGKIDSLCQIWNVTETPVLKKLLPATFPSINYQKTIYIPRLTEKITEPHEKTTEPQHYIDLINQEPLLAGAKYTFDPDPQNLRVPILILSPSPLHKIQHEEFREGRNCCRPRLDEHIKYEKIIIHVHGGGFVGQSPFSHQNYTRAWANQLNVPVFSVEYRLAPQYKFPDGLDDVWQAYTWIVKYAHRYLGVVPHKIILAGDSAGGNFIIGVCIKAISCGFRLPDGLLLVYPAVNLDLEKISMGGFYSLEDPILNFHSFFLIIKAYLKDESQLKDYFVSPNNCKDSIISNFPQTKMMITLKDPLSSDGLRFADKLLRNGVNLEVYKYPEFIHGCMNMVHSNGIPIFTRFLTDSIELLKNLFN